MLGVSNIMGRIKCEAESNDDDGEEGVENYNLEELTDQCQRYEEQIVELHSVIAELSRKLEVEQDDIIHEETETSGDEFDEANDDSYNYDEDIDRKACKSPNTQMKYPRNRKQLNEEDEDYNSLVFERDLDSQLTQSNCIVEFDKGPQGGSDPILRSSCCDNELKTEGHDYKKDMNELKSRLLNNEILGEVKQELVESRQELDQLKELLTIKDGEKEAIIIERNSLTRQLKDLQATMEYQDAKMDLRKKPSSRKSSTTSARLNAETCAVASIKIENGVSKPCLPTLLNSISTPEMANTCEGGSLSSKQVQRRRSLRKSKKNKSTDQVIYEHTHPTGTTSSEKVYDDIESIKGNEVSEQMTCLSSLPHESSNRDSKIKIKVNRTNRPHRIESPQNLHTKCVREVNDAQNKRQNNIIFENSKFIKSLAKLVKEHESQSNNLLLASECSDHLIEAYDVLIALYEYPMTGDSMSEKTNRRETIENVAKHLISRLDMASNLAAKATNGSAGDVCSSLSPSSERHQLLHNCFPGINQMAWEESSAYSHTTGSATSTANSLSSATNTGNLHDHGQPLTTTESTVNCHNLPSKVMKNGYHKNDGSGGRSKDGGRPDLLSMTPSRNASINSNSGSPVPQSKYRNKGYESRLKEHINQLKAERASLQQQFDISQLSDVLSSFNINQNDIEQETLNMISDQKEKVDTLDETKAAATSMKSKLEPIPVKNPALNTKLEIEREADFQAELYLINQEKKSLEMKLDDRHSLESMLRSHIEHLREENDRLSRGEGRLTSLSREDKLGKRVDSLLETLDRVTKNSEQRQIHSDELMGDLKRANRTLSEALEKNKRKYQSRIKRLEQQLVTAATTTTNQNQNNNDKSRMTNNQPQAQNRKQSSHHL